MTSAGRLEHLRDGHLARSPGGGAEAGDRDGQDSEAEQDGEAANESFVGHERTPKNEITPGTDEFRPEL